MSDLSPRPIKETSKILTEIIKSDSWIIDGFGSYDVMKNRFICADLVIFVDFPLWRNYWWCTKRRNGQTIEKESWEKQKGMKQVYVVLLNCLEYYGKYTLS